MEALRLDQTNSGTVSSASKHIVGVLRLSATIGASATAIFGLCWAGTRIAFLSPIHAYIGLFTLAEPSSVQALAEGLCWSLLSGALAGAVIAIFYNAFSWLQPR